MRWTGLHWRSTGAWNALRSCWLWGRCHCKTPRQRRVPGRQRRQQQQQEAQPLAAAAAQGQAAQALHLGGEQQPVPLVCLVMKLYQGTLESSKRHSEQDISEVVRQVLQGLGDMHQGKGKTGFGRVHRCVCCLQREGDCGCACLHVQAQCSLRTGVHAACIR
jgi:hypothetical protein